MPHPPELHKGTIDWFARLLLLPPGHEGAGEHWDREMDTAIQHVADCEQCLVELDAMVRVLSPGDDFILPSCQECAPLLTEIAGLEESEVRDRFLLAWLHLLRCEHCRSMVERLQRMVARERAGAYGPRPAVTAIGVKTVKTTPEIWQRVRGGIRRLGFPIALFDQGDDVALRPIQEGRALPTAQLPSGWRLQPVTVPIRRAKAGGRTPRVWTTVLRADAGLEIGLVAYPAGEKHVELEVSILSEQPSARALVTLTDEQGLSPWAEETDDQGSACLTEVSLKRYTLEVAQAGTRWLIPLDLSSA